MKDKRCFICKFKQDQTMRACEDTIYTQSGKVVTIGLCWNHSVELFKAGQRSFMEKHSYVFSNNFGYESDLNVISLFNNARKERAWY